MSRLGAHADGAGVDFAVFSSVADAVDLCLFDAAGNEERRPLEQAEGYVWTGRVEGAGHGQRYGYRVHGPAPCNPAKLLLDPYARGIEGEVTWDPAVTAHDDRDSAPFVPRSVVQAAPFDWGDDRHPATPLADSVMYELHVKGFTKLHPGVPEELRGTYAGLAHPAAIDAPARPRRHGRRAPARPHVRLRPGAGGARAAQLLGLPVDRLLRAPCGLRGAATRCRSSGRW